MAYWSNPTKAPNAEHKGTVVAKDPTNSSNYAGDRLDKSPENQTISALRKELDENKQKVKDIETMNFMIQNENASLKVSLAALENKSEVSAKLNDFLQAQIAELKLRNEMLESKNEPNQKLLTQKPQNPSELELELKSLSERNSTLESAVKALKVKNQSLAEKIQELEKRPAIIVPPEEVRDDDTGSYDCVIGIQKFRDIAQTGWEIEFPSLRENTISKETFASIGDSIGFVSVTGAFDKGKTFLLNKLCGANFPSSKRFETKGISFKSTTIKGSNLIVIDSAGCHSPFKMSERVEDKRETEKRIRDLIFLLSDFFILVVNDYTTLDQEILEKLEKQLQGNKAKSDKIIIVVHNLKDVYDEEGRIYAWNKVVELYDSTDPDKKALVNSVEMLGQRVNFLQSKFSRHAMLINDNTAYGKFYNELVIEMLKTWMIAICTTHNPKNLFESFFSIVSQSLNSKGEEIKNDSNTLDEDLLYIERGLKVTRTEDPKKLLLSCNDPNLKSAFILPNNYEPAIDVIENDREYIIIIDAPGCNKPKMRIEKYWFSIEISREVDYEGESKYCERSFGTFLRRFKIPQKYQRKPTFKFENGVIRLRFEVLEDIEFDED
jgi:HSP20 family molecular chaperone IbpA